QRTRWLFGVGATYAIVVRGFCALVALFPPGLGVLLFEARSDALGLAFGIVELGVDLVLPTLAIFIAVVYPRRRFLRLETVLGVVFLVDNFVYIGSSIAPAIDGDMLWIAALVTILQLPLMAMAVDIIQRSRATAKAASVPAELPARQDSDVG